jgi:hypothetical protein
VPVDPANAHELAQVGGELTGAHVLEGTLRYLLDTGDWQPGALATARLVDR